MTLLAVTQCLLTTSINYSLCCNNKVVLTECFSRLLDAVGMVRHLLRWSLTIHHHQHALTTTICGHHHIYGHLHHLLLLVVGHRHGNQLSTTHCSCLTFHTDAIND